MNCPTCGGRTVVYCTKKELNKVTRYRKCVNCNFHRFSTVEEILDEVSLGEHPVEVKPVVETVEKDPVTIKEKRKKTEQNLMAQALTDIYRGLARKMKGEFA